MIFGSEYNQITKYNELHNLHTSSLKRDKRQVLQDAVLLNNNTVLTADKTVPPAQSNYQLALDISSQVRFNKSSLIFI